MTGLRSWVRDPEIPELAGDRGLRPPRDDELVELVQRHLLRPGAPPVQSVEWVYARWKPAVSLTTVHRLHLEDGGEELAVVKRYRGDKAEVLAERPLPAGRPPGLSDALQARVVLPSAAMVLYTPPADRELGLRHLLDVKRFSKLLRDGGLAEPGLVRRRRTSFELVRYKPERRAVYRVEIHLRDEQRTGFALAVRVLPSAQAASVISRRAAFEARGGAELAPRLVCAHARHGLLVEPWLELSTTAPDDFSRALEAGGVLARLHAMRPSEVGELAERVELSELADFFGAEPGLGDELAHLRWPPDAGARTWVHGDFHPDQVARVEGRSILLDLDSLHVGRSADDLAGWIADHLFERPELAFDAAASSLLEGYADAGGHVPEASYLRRLVGCELALRSAAALRRLEFGALARARAGLARARELAWR